MKTNRSIATASSNRAEPQDEIKESEVIQEPAVIAEPETASDGSEQEETTDWGCPCQKYVYKQTHTGSTLYQKRHKNKIVYLCETIDSECVPGKPTRVGVVHATVKKVEVKNRISGAWIIFLGEHEDEHH